MLQVISGGLACDARGSLRFINDFDPYFYGIRRMYQVENNPLCEIRAWHGHRQEQKFVYCPRGSATIAAIKMSTDDNEIPSIDPSKGASPPHTFTLSALQPRVLHIPAGMANGFRMLEPGTILIFYSTSTLAESAQDDYRFPFDPLDKTFDIEVR